MDVLKSICDSRNDSWGIEVKGRLHTISGLVSAEAVYHRMCYSPFHRLNSVKPGFSKSLPGKTVGRPIDLQMQEAFDSMCESLERADDLRTLEDLVIEMQRTASDPDRVYSVTQLKRKLIIKYGKHIFFQSVKEEGT